MPVTKAKKKEASRKLNADLKNVSSMVVATYSKLTRRSGLRAYARLCAARVRSTGRKKTRSPTRAKGTKVEEALKDLGGVTSIAYTSGDPVAMAKALSRYAKDTPEFTSR